MLPPVEDAVLKNNPKFAALHATLTGTLLNPSGSTKNHQNLRKHEAAAEGLKKLQLQNIKQKLILRALLNLDPTATTSRSNAAPLRDSSHLVLKLVGPPPPENENGELLELITILSLKLSHPNLPPSVLTTLESSNTLTLLPKYTPKIADLISRYLHNQAVSIVRVTNPTSNASFLHRSIPKLSFSIQTIQQNALSKKEALEIERVRLVSSASSVIEKYRYATELAIRILEQNKHGQISRAAKSRADLVAAKAQQELLSVRNIATKASGLVYSAETKEALRNYVLHLRDAKSRLRQKKRDEEKVLWGYGVGREGDGRKEVVMKEIARVYVALGREVEEVKRDVRRLEGGRV